MPQRFLRPGITTSDSWNACSFEAQSFYVRLLTIVDDHGRYDGRDAILLAQCFALRPDMSAPMVGVLKGELYQNGLIVCYKSGGKEFIQLTKWSERIRSASKWPSPDNSCAQLTADASKKTLPSPSPSSVAFVSRHTPTPSPSSEARSATEQPAQTGKSVCVNLEDIAQNKTVEPNGSHHSLIETINGIYKRETGAPWPYDEQCLAVEISRRPAWPKEAKELIEYRRSLREKRWFPQSARSLLQKWVETLDKARIAKNSPSLRGYAV